MLNNIIYFSFKSVCAASMSVLLYVVLCNIILDLCILNLLWMDCSGLLLWIVIGQLLCHRKV